MFVGLLNEEYIIIVTPAPADQPRPQTHILLVHLNSGVAFHHSRNNNNNRRMCLCYIRGEIVWIQQTIAPASMARSSLDADNKQVSDRGDRESTSEWAAGKITRAVYRRDETWTNKLRHLTHVEVVWYMCGAGRFQNMFFNCVVLCMFGLCLFVKACVFLGAAGACKRKSRPCERYIR